MGRNPLGDKTEQGQPRAVLVEDPVGQYSGMGPASRSAQLNLLNDSKVIPGHLADNQPAILSKHQQKTAPADQGGVLTPPRLPLPEVLSSPRVETENLAVSIL